LQRLYSDYENILIITQAYMYMLCRLKRKKFLANH